MAAGHFFLHIEALQARAEKGPLRLAEVVEILGEDAHLLLMLFLCLPFAQPIPLPGFSTPLGLMLASLSALHFLKKKVWLPARFREREIPQRHLLSMLKSLRKIWSWFEKWLRPRWSVLLWGMGYRFLNHALIILHAGLLALPLPIPFSNNLPALSILCLLLAYLEEDGLMILVSYVFSVGTVMFFLSIAATVSLGVANWPPSWPSWLPGFQ